MNAAGSAEPGDRSARDRLLDELPTAHAVALRLLDRGAGDAEIADALGMPIESVARLITIAQAKMRALERSD